MGTFPFIISEPLLSEVASPLIDSIENNPKKHWKPLEHIDFKKNC